MTLTISIPADEEARLQQRAAERGQDVATYVSQLVSHFAAKPTPLEELSGPIYKAFVDSGMTDDELSDLLEKAKHEARADRRARGRT
jgi:hypothetical protein